MSIITKLSQDVTQYYKNNTSSIGVNARIHRDMQLWTTQKVLTSYKKKTQETSMGQKDRALDRSTADLWCRRYAILITRKFITVQAPISEYADPGEELPNEWQYKCQLACIDKHMCIDKFESKSMYWKSCREHMDTRAGNEAASKVNMKKISYISQNYLSVRLVHRRNNPNKETLIYTLYLMSLYPESYNLNDFLN